MRRDLDLVRSLLLTVESDGEHPIADGYTNEEVADHAQQLLGGTGRRGRRSEPSKCSHRFYIHSAHIERTRLYRCYAKPKHLDKNEGLGDAEPAKMDAIDPKRSRRTRNKGRPQILTRALVTIAFTLITGATAMSVELFRYRGAARDGGTLEYLFATDEEHLPQTVPKEKVAEIAADFMTTFYHIQIGALETQEFRTTPVPFWLVAFSEAIQGPAKQLFFVVILPNGTVVEPSVSKRL
jgi:hypothetical protein